VLAGRHIVLGVTGGIAAYKAVEVCRRMVDEGAHVAPILTEGALRFVGRTTFDALASEPAHTSLWDDPDPIPHTRLGQRADVVVVAPCTARVLGLYAGGIADDLLTNVLLATRAPVVVAPAMHTEMWEHPSVRENVARLMERGVHVVPPESGRLAGGDEGPGRLADPATIVAAVERVLIPQDLAGLRFLITAGGTREPIDAVRVITNRSSGKQGHALADEAARRGAKVTLVTAADRPASPLVDLVRVDTAAEMADAVLARSEAADVVIMAAAVADFRPAQPAPVKLKKDEGPPPIVLEPTVDILATLGGRRRPGQTLVGFAAETGGDVRAKAIEKLQRKRADLVVANDVSDEGAGFDHETNEVLIVAADGAEHRVARRDKRDVATVILDTVLDHRSKQ
jgi:phosphopantothenoylcysteine decarboxylase/phosphopantothenate--cysteine ligase